MNQEFLRKYVGDRRSAINTVQNRVPLDLSVANPTLDAAYKGIEELAKKHEAFKIENEKNSLIIELNKIDMDYENEFLTDPTVYNNQEKFDVAMAAFTENVNRKNMMIKQSKYLTRQDIDEFNTYQNKNNGEKLNSMQYKRNQMFIKETYDMAVINREQLAEIGANLDPNDTSKFQEVLNGLSRTAEAFRTSGMSEGKIAAMMGETIADMEYARDSKAMSSIANNSSLSYEQKMGQIEAYKKGATSGQYIDKVVSEYKDKFGIKDDSLETFKQSIVLRAGKVTNGKDKSLNQVERAIKTERANALKEEKIRAKEEERENRKIAGVTNKNPGKMTKDERAEYLRQERIKKAANANDAYKYVKEKFDASPTTAEFVKDNYLLEETYNTSLSDVGDINNQDYVDVVSKSDISALKEQMTNYKLDGRGDREIIEEIIIPYAEEIAGNDEYVKNAILKNLGMKLPGYNPTVLLKAKEDPKIVEVAGAYKDGKKSKKDVTFDVKVTRIDEIFKSKNGRTRYRDLSDTVGATPDNKEKLNTLIIGKMKQKGFNKFDSLDVEMFLTEEENYVDIKNSIPALRELHITPKNYKPKKVRTDNLPKIDQEDEEIMQVEKEKKEKIKQAKEAQKEKVEQQEKEQEEEGISGGFTKIIRN
ncbi:MAG: hypothetical protein ACRCX2_03685 [Paraclostridium sp.]